MSMYVVLMYHGTDAEAGYQQCNNLDALLADGEKHKSAQDNIRSTFGDNVKCSVYFPSHWEVYFDSQKENELEAAVGAYITQMGRPAVIQADNQDRVTRILSNKGLAAKKRDLVDRTLSAIGRIKDVCLEVK